MSAASESFSPRYRRLAIVILALSAYAPTLRMGFLWDDHVMIEQNPRLQSWSLDNLKHDFTTDVFEGHGDPYYRPAQTLANRLDYTLWGLHPFGYHLTNFLAHALNAVLFSELTLALGFLPLTALLVGCLFAVHPIVVEQLMIIAGRAELFSLCFTLLTLLLLLREQARDLILATGAFACALFFKESAILAPALAALVFFVRRERSSAYLRLLPLLFVIPPYLWLRWHAVGSPLAVLNVGYLLQFFTMAFPKVLLIYARLIFVPWNLHSHRLMPHLSHAWPLLLAALVGSVLWMIKKDRRFGLFCLGWFILVFLPKTPGMIYGGFMLDHWAYPATFAIVLPLSVFYTQLWMSRQNRWQELMALTFFPLLIGWALLVHLNVALRDSDEKMYRWALRFTTSNPIKSNLGIVLLQQGRASEAIRYLEDVHDEYPEDSNNTNALAQCYWLSGNQARAIHILETLLQLKPNDALTLRHLEAIRRKRIRPRQRFQHPPLVLDN